MSTTYQKGWEDARLAYYLTSEYEPIACITSMTESNSSEFEEKINTCTSGATVKTVKDITRTVSIDGEVTSTSSYTALRGLMDAKAEVTWMKYNDNTAEYFVGIITALDKTSPADGDATFTMTIEVNGSFSSTNPKT